MKVGAAIAEIMKREGIEILTGYPVNHLIEYAAEIDIRPIMVRQERIGLHMADAISRLTSGRTLGAFCMQHGPGSENAFGGVAQCYGESVPVLVLPMGYPRRLAYIDPNFSSVASMRSISKMAEPVILAAEVPNIMRRAFTRLRKRPRRPRDRRDPRRHVERGGAGTARLHARCWSPATAPDPVHVKLAAQKLAAAQDLVIYAGQGVHYARAWPQLKRLAELLAAPVVTSLGGKSAFDETHPLSLGAAGVAMAKTVPMFMGKADVIFGIGCSFTESSFALAIPKGKTIIHSTLDPDHLNKDVRAEIGLVGDAGLVLDAVLAELEAIISFPRDIDTALPPRSSPSATPGSRSGCRS